MNSTNSSDSIPDYVPSFNAALLMHFAKNPSTYNNMKFFLYGFPFIFLFGIVGNCFSFATMCTKRMAKHSYAIYLASLAVYDTGMLLFNFVAWMNVVSYTVSKTFVIFVNSTFKCKVLEFICDVLMVGSAWTIVLVTIERLIMIAFPFKSRDICKPKVAKIVVAVSAVIFLLTSPWTASSTDYLHGYGCRRTTSDMYSDFFFSCTYYVFLPIIMILIFNSILIYLISRLKGGVRSSSGSKATITVLLMSCTYLVLLFPLGVTALLFGIYGDKGKIVPAMDTSRILLCCNYAVNYYIYVSGNQEIRSAFCEMIGLRRGSYPFNGTRAASKRTNITEDSNMSKSKSSEALDPCKERRGGSTTGV